MKNTRNGARSIFGGLALICSVAVPATFITGTQVQAYGFPSTGTSFRTLPGPRLGDCIIRETITNNGPSQFDIDGFIQFAPGGFAEPGFIIRQDFGMVDLGLFNPSPAITSVSPVAIDEAVLQTRCNLTNFEVVSTNISPAGTGLLPAGMTFRVRYDYGSARLEHVVRVGFAGSQATTNTRTNFQLAPVISGAPAAIDTIDSFDVTVTFNGAAVDFDDLTDITATNGTITSITPVSATEYTVTVTPNGTSDITLQVPILSAFDTAGGGNIVSNVVTITNNVDVAPPIPTVAADAGTPAFITDLTPFTVEVTFNEDINDFGDVLTDVVITNGTPTSITPTGTPNTFTVTITPDGTGDVSVTVPVAVATDDGDNDNVVSNTLVVSDRFDETTIDLIEEILEDDLLVTTGVLSQNASNISRRAADRLRFDRGQACVAEINDLLRTTPVRFASDKFFIDASNNQLLDDIASALSKCDVANFMIAGHTDSDASDAYNITLSQNRVDAVKAALARRGIANARLQTRGFGESRPIATNATEEGQALNRRVEFILLDAAVGPVEQSCGAGRPFGGNLNGNANDSGANVNGEFGSEGYNCVTGELTETWGKLSVVRDDDVGTQGMASFGMSKERQVNGVLSGRFVEGYVSRTDVDNGTVEGEITGVGVHAGLFGARATEGGLVLSYYGSAAVGRHAFELSAAADADGSYMYAGVFAGGALTGEQDLGSAKLKPRAGVDLGYSQSFGEDISNTGTLEIEPATYARGFIELGVLTETGQGASGEASTLEIAPRAFCETTDESNADACGFGARVNYTGAKSTSGTQWDVEFDYETIGDRDSASIAVARAQDVMGGMGVSKSSFGATGSGALEAAQTVSFTW